MKNALLQQGADEIENSSHILSAPAQRCFDSQQASEFVDRLGKDPKTTRLRAFFEKDDPRKSGDSGRKGFLSATTIDQWQHDGRGVYVVINDGGDKDADITECRVLFIEWDDKPREWQVNAWKELGLPKPSMQVDSGVRSIHNYWVLAAPISPTKFRELQKRLAQHCGSDSTLCNPSRVMRLPGTARGNGQPVSLIHANTNKYDVAEFEELLNQQVSAPPLPTPPAPTASPRPLSEIRDALSRIPPRVPGSGTYSTDRNVLWGLIAAVEEAGGTRDEAITLMEAHSPQWRDVRQVAESGGEKIHAGTFWHHARENGFELKRHHLKRNHPQPPTPTKRSLRRLSYTRSMACFERCVQIQAKRERNSLRRRARLLKAAKDLGLASYIKAPDIAQRVLEAKDHHQGNYFRPLSAADRAAMPKPVVRWLLPDLLPAGDLSIIGGRPKVGKTRLAIAMAAAVLNGKGFLELPAPICPHTVLLVTDDQADGDTAQMLEALDLWHHPQLIWSRNFRLTEGDIDALLLAIKANPEALVVLDSLRSISRSLQHGENDPEIGATLYDLKQAVIDSGGTLLLIHHCNKTVDLVGTEALSGHNAIAGAANTVFTLHYLPGENGQPNKASPERRLVREARSGNGFDLVVTPSDNTFRMVSTLSAWRQQLKAASKRDRLTELQEQVLELLEEHNGQWLTRKQITEELGLPWEDRGRNKEAKRVRDALNRLVKLGELDSERSGTAASYRASREAQETVLTSEPTSDGNGTRDTSAVVDSVDNGDKPTDQQTLSTMTSIRC